MQKFFEDVLESPLALYGLLGLGAVILVYSVYKSSAVAALANGASQVSTAAANAINSVSNTTTTFIDNSTKTGTVSNAIAAAALGPFGAIYTIFNSADQLDALFAGTTNGQ